MCNQSMSVLFLSMTFAVFFLQSLVESNEREFRRVCYFTNWSNKLRVVKARFYLKDIDPYLCTHIIYAFAKINTDSFRLNPTEIDDDNGSNLKKSGRYFNFTDLKTKNPKLVTLLSVGGASLSNGFISVVSSSHLTRLFASNCAIYLRDRNFDGLDIDWEFPGRTLKNQFTDLIRAMREEFEREAFESGRKRLLLTIAAGVGDEPMASYNITELSKYVDFVNLMAYDFHGIWNGITAFSSPLYSRLSNYQFSHRLSQDWAVHQWLNESISPDKLVLGVTAAGLSFTLEDPNQIGVGAHIIDKGNPGPLRATSGHLAYFEICQMLKNGATEVWDEEQKVNYAYQDNQWVGFDNPDSIRIKTQYALDMNLGGMMLWSLDWDDFMGTHCREGKFPLLSVIKEMFPDPTTTTATTTTMALATTSSPMVHNGPSNIPTNIHTLGIDGATKISYCSVTVILLIANCIHLCILL